MGERDAPPGTIGRGARKVKAKATELSSKKRPPKSATVEACANLAALRDMSGELTTPKTALYLGDRDVPDPWGKDEAAFAAVVALVQEGAARHLP